MRVWALSDVHTDYKENLAWCEELSTTEYQNDVLILAGDVTDDLPTLRRTLQLFKQRWAHVFFTPGNHDLWVRRGEKARYDSIGKLKAVFAVCTELGVRTAPACINGLWIVPLLSWYHKSWDREPDLAGAAPAHKMMTDFHVCTWPDPGLNAHDTSLAEYFDAMNDEPLQPVLAALQQAQQQAQQQQDQAQQQGQQEMQQQQYKRHKDQAQQQDVQQQQDQAQQPQQHRELDTVGAAIQLGARIAEVSGAGTTAAVRNSASEAPAAAAAPAAAVGGGGGSAMPGGDGPAGMAGAALPVPAHDRGPASAPHGSDAGIGAGDLPAANTVANGQANGHAAAANPQRPPLITFSHFLPYQELLPEKRMLRHPNLAKAVGSDPLADRIAALQPDCHVFGHTHFGWDARLPTSPSPQTRFVQCPLAYPPERTKRGMGSWKPKLIWDSAYGGITPQADSFWSSVYAQRPRDPGNLQPAPWCCLDWK